MTTLADGITEEIKRVTEILTQYHELPNNAGLIGSMMIKHDLDEATKALASGDVIKILQSYEILKSIE